MPADHIKFNSDQRHQQMGELGKLLYAEYLKSIKPYSIFRDDKHPFYDLLKRKLTGKPLRAFFTLKMFNYINRENRQYSKTDLHFFNIQLPLIIEFVITIQYYDNQVQDQKGGVTSKDKADKNRSYGNIWKELLYGYIDKCPYSNQVGYYVRKMFTYVSIGQYIEGQYCRFANFKEYNEVNLYGNYDIEDIICEKLLNEATAELAKHVTLTYENKMFFRIYLKRMHLTCAALFVLTTRLLIGITGFKNNSNEDIETFSVFFGIMRQVVNDNTDFVPSYLGHRTAAKIEKDAFSDLRNKNITLPIFVYLVNNRSGPIKTLLEQKKEREGLLEEKHEQELFKDIAGIIRKTTIPLGKYISKQSLGFLEPNNNTTLLFREMADIAKYNKYYHHFYKKPRK